MKKSLKTLALALATLFVMPFGAKAATITYEEIPNDSYVIGTHVFTRESGALTVKKIMLAASTIKGTDLESMQIIYKDIMGNLFEVSAGRDEETNKYPQAEVKLTDEIEYEYYDLSVEIDSLEALKEAIAEKETNIKLVVDITGIDETITIPYAVNFNGNGHKLQFNTLNRVNGSASALVLTASNSKVTSLTIKLTAAEGWQGNYAMQVYNASNVVLKDLILTDADAALIVNASNVVLEGNINVSGNEFGGIEVSKGSAEGLKSSVLTVNGTITMSDEATSKPIIWIEADQGTVVDTNNVLVENTTVPQGAGKNQTFYYTDEKFTVVE